MFLIIQSIFVYSALAISLYFLGRVASQRQSIHLRAGRRLTFWTWEIVASLLLFGLVSGLRWNVGIDHNNYLNEYLHAQQYGATIKDFEIGFRVFTQGVASLGFHYTFYFSLLAFMQLFFVYRTFKDERHLLPYVGLTVVLGFHYLSWMNGIRQMLAATIFLFSIQFIVKRKLVPYISMIFLASLFHKSALILIPFYFFPNRDLFPSRLFVFSASVLCIFVGMDSAWISFVDKYISLIIGWVGYERYSENISYFVEQSEGANFGPRMISMFLLFLVTIFYSPALKMRFSGSGFMMSYNIYVMGFLLYSLFSNAHHIFLRPISYLTICSIPVIAYLILYLSRSSKKNKLPFILVLLLACSYTPISSFADYGKAEKDYSNYKLWFLYDHR